MTRARISDITALAAKSFKVKVECIKGTRGSRAVCRARLAVYYIARLNGHTGGQIGQSLGGRDPSTVSDGTQSCRDLMERDPRFRNLVHKVAQRAAALPPFVMERRGRIYAARVIPRSFDPTKFFKAAPTPKPALQPLDYDLSDDELLSRRVAAHYAEARA